jgi:hypothetical protein
MKQETNKKNLYFIEAKHGTTTYSFKKENMIETKKFLERLGKEGFIEVKVFKIKRVI